MKNCKYFQEGFCSLGPSRRSRLRCKGRLQCDSFEATRKLPKHLAIKRPTGPSRVPVSSQTPKSRSLTSLEQLGKALGGVLGGALANFYQNRETTDLSRHPLDPTPPSL